MAWINILDIPGLTYRIEYRAVYKPGFGDVSGEWTEVPDSDPVWISSKAFVALHDSSGDTSWHTYRVFITSPANYPMMVRVRATTRDTGYRTDHYMIGEQADDESTGLALSAERIGNIKPLLPTTGEAQHTWLSGDYPIFTYSAERGGGSYTDNTVIIEVSSAPPFWITHRGTQEQP